MNVTLTGTIISGKIGSNSNEGVIHTPKITRIRASPSVYLRGGMQSLYFRSQEQKKMFILVPWMQNFVSIFAEFFSIKWFFLFFFFFHCFEQN